MERKDKKERKPRRTRSLIRKDIFDAVGGIVKNEGFSKLSINLISEYAEMETVVIYRHFTSLEKIIEQYVERFDFWLSLFTLNEEKEEKATNREAYLESIFEMLDFVHKKREIQQLIVWELTEDNHITDGIAQRRELDLEAFSDKYVTLFEGTGIDVKAISAIIISAIYYLSAHKNRSPFNGISTKGTEGRQIIMDSISQIIGLLFDKKEKIKEKAIARKMLEESIPMEVVMKVTGLSKVEILG